MSFYSALHFATEIYCNIDLHFLYLKRFEPKPKTKFRGVIIFGLFHIHVFGFRVSILSSLIISNYK